MRTAFRVALVGALAVPLLAIGSAASADPSADPSGRPARDPAAAADRARLVCARVPNLTARVDRVLDRLQAGADRPGSIAWLRARADRARANGHPDLATALDNRVNVRTALVPVLQNRKERLPQVAAWCAAHGYGTGS